MDKRTGSADLGPAFEIGALFRDTKRHEYVWYVDKRKDRGGKLGFQTENGEMRFYRFDGELVDDHLISVEEVEEPLPDPPHPRPQAQPCADGNHEFENEPFESVKDAVTAVCQECGMSAETSHLLLPSGESINPTLECSCVVCDNVFATDSSSIWSPNETYPVCDSCDSEKLTTERIEENHLT